MSVETTARTARAAEPALEASIAASELVLFCRDLRGTLTEVVAAAVGRALAAHPEVCGPARSAETGVGVAVDADGDVLVPVVRNAWASPLPLVRAEVARLVEAARTGRLAPADVGGAAVTVSDLAAGTASTRIEASARCILAVDPPARDSHDLSLALSVKAPEVDVLDAGRFFATVVRLLRHPYRRLV